MKFLLDTKALIAFFNDEEGAKNVEKILKEIDENKAGGFVSAITLTEVYYLYSRERSADFAKMRIEQIKLSNLKSVVITEEIAICNILHVRGLNTTTSKIIFNRANI